MSQKPRKPNLPATRSRVPAKWEQKMPALTQLRDLELTKGLPPATIVYGAAAGALLALALYLMAHGKWIDGLLTLLPAACVLGFAMHLMKHGQPRP